MNLGIGEQRAEQSVDEFGMNVADVRVDPTDEVTFEDEHALPERLALALEDTVAGQDFAVLHYLDAGALGDRDGPVGGTRIDDNDFVEQRNPIHQRVLEGSDDLADRGLFIQRRQAEADGDALALLEIYQAAQVGELFAVKGVLGEPAIDALAGGGTIFDPEGPVGILEAADGPGRLDDHHTPGQPPKQAGHRRTQHHRPVHQAHGCAEHDHLMLRCLTNDGLAYGG